MTNPKPAIKTQKIWKLIGVKPLLIHLIIILSYKLECLHRKNTTSIRFELCGHIGAGSIRLMVFEKFGMSGLAPVFPKIKPKYTLYSELSIARTV